MTCSNGVSCQTAHQTGEDLCCFANLSDEKLCSAAAERTIEVSPTYFAIKQPASSEPKKKSIQLKFPCSVF